MRGTATPIQPAPDVRPRRPAEGCGLAVFHAEGGVVAPRAGDKDIVENNLVGEGEMKLEELMKTDNFKSLRLAEQIYLIIHKTPLSIPVDSGGHTVWVGCERSTEIAERIVDLIKSHGELYQGGETEEITFAEPTWFITIEDSKM